MTLIEMSKETPSEQGLVEWAYAQAKIDNENVTWDDAKEGVRRFLDAKRG